MDSVDLLITNASELLTLQGSKTPRIGSQMGKLSIIEGGSVAVSEGRIVAVGRRLRYRAETTIDATGKVVMPGFVDPHTHVVFAGSREQELALKLEGLSYMEILKRGFGIFSTVRATRKASPAELLKQSQKRLDTMLRYGTTTCEAKTGYGLEVKTEVKLLQVQRKLAKTHPMDLVSTFLGAHAVPQGMSAEEYVSLVIEEMLPNVRGLARFCDVFCEKDVFSVGQSRRILLAGKQLGLLPKIHADEIVDTGGAALAAEVGAVSADHLLRSSAEGLKAMARTGVVGVLLPGTPFCLMMQQYAAARKMIQLGVPVALATDLNPNCWTENMQFMVQLACLNMRLTPAEAVTAATFNAACAIGMQHIVGSLEPGKQADLLILDCPSYQFLPYHFGVNLVETVIKKGCVV
ncbi:MAG: imidazolonepropionase [Candidatus Thermoplasmatota archaeon]|nr:imidazolonepropionase [Candidatus Thermoplasmatota archaeon]